MFRHDSLKGEGWEEVFWIIRWFACAFRNILKNEMPHIKLNFKSYVCSLRE